MDKEKKLKKKPIKKNKKISIKGTLKKMELNENKSLQSENEFNYLYPNLNDPNFNVKLAEKKEFNELKTKKRTGDIEKSSEQICNPTIFESLNHQLIVKNYMSFQTPYNNLLLFHGVGTGKTCSSILVCEEMRKYFKQFGISKKIIILASPNVQTNYKLQLFDERKLKKINGLWNLDACTGNNFINEINPMKIKNLEKDVVIRQIKSLIRQHYSFYGAEKFSNYLDTLPVTGIKKKFSNRLIVIDEVHNLRTIGSDKKNITKNLHKLAKNTENLKLLLMSATPMFNSPREIVWLLNLMNKNDKRPIINENDIFNKDDELIVSETGEEIGKNILVRKSTGYVSYFRGENPYSFPYRIFPSMFMNEHTMLNYSTPRFQINEKIISPEQQIEKLDLCILKLQNYQEAAYNAIVQNTGEIENKNNISGLNYSVISNPLQALDIVYPNDSFVSYLKEENDKPFKNTKELIGKDGLDNVMIYNKKNRENYKYRFDIVKTYGRIFSPQVIEQYSSKIKFIMDKIQESKGIVMIYAQYIDSGCIPLALALEELGYTRYGRSNLFKDAPVPKNKLKYAMITGTSYLSPNSKSEIKAVSDSNNINGEKIKVVIISQAGSEGIDFKNIRQIHILDPWWNLNRIEQIIGRGVRNCSHKKLPFKERNVQIFMYGTQLDTPEIESADMYMYRIAEKKSIKIGKITRILKENSMDCLLNKNVIEEDTLNQDKEQLLSTGEKIIYKVGDKPFSALCDYMENCNYLCKPKNSVDNINYDSYNQDFIVTNLEVIIRKIKDLFKEQYIYHIDDLVRKLNIVKEYPIMQIYTALTNIIENEIIIKDVLERNGFLVNIDKYYMFQPEEITNKNISAYDRMRPVDLKPKSILVNLKNVKIEDTSQDNEEIINLSVLKKYYKLATKKEKYTKKDLDETIPRNKYYKRVTNARFRIKMYLPELDNNAFNDSIVEHILDNLETDTKKKIISQVLFDKNLKTEFESKLKKIIEKKFILHNGNNFIIITNFNKNLPELYKINVEATTENNILVKATDVEIDEILTKLFGINYSLNKTIGFSSLFKNKNYVIFKVKYTDKKRDTGFRCDQKGRAHRIKVLNESILDSKDYVEYKQLDEKTGKVEKDEKGKPIIIKNPVMESVIDAEELCVDQELLLRYFDNTKKNNLRWYLSLEENFFYNK